MLTMKPKTAYFSLKIAPALKKRVQDVSKQTGVPMTTFVESAFDAVIAFYEEHGYVPSPFHIVPGASDKSVPTPASKA